MLVLRPLSSESPEDRANVLRVFYEARSYTELVSGRAPCADDVDDFFFGKPERKSATDKSVFGLFLGETMIGCADVIRAYPTDDTVWIGLLLLAETYRGRGYGSVALETLTGMASQWGHQNVQLAIVSTNTRAQVFWRREGFEEIRRTSNAKFIGEIVVMQRPIIARQR